MQHLLFLFYAMLSIATALPNPLQDPIIALDLLARSDVSSLGPLQARHLEDLITRRQPVESAHDISTAKFFKALAGN